MTLSFEEHSMMQSRFAEAKAITRTIAMMMDYVYSSDEDDYPLSEDEKDSSSSSGFAAVANSLKESRGRTILNLLRGEGSSTLSSPPLEV